MPRGRCCRGTFAYTPAAGTVLGAGTQTLKVVFTPDGSDRLRGGHEDGVAGGQQGGSGGRVDDAGIDYSGDSVVGHAAGCDRGGGVTGLSLPGTFAYTPAAGTVLGAGDADVVSLVYSGRCGPTIRRRCRRPRSRWGKATPNLTWATPAAISYGTALSAAQLDAVALDAAGGGAAGDVCVYAGGGARCSGQGRRR